jgi:NAD(P)-dependent dehydrogenase (short-subunit alcohol dehydrogenase family)
LSDLLASSSVAETPKRVRPRQRAFAPWGRIACLQGLMVSNAEDCYSLVEKGLERFGSVNGLVNSAGIADRGTLLDTSLELWEWHFNTNARSPFLTVQRLLPTWSKSESLGASREPILTRAAPQTRRALQACFPPSSSI